MKIIERKLIKQLFGSLVLVLVISITACNSYLPPSPIFTPTLMPSLPKDTVSKIPVFPTRTITPSIAPLKTSTQTPTLEFTKTIVPFTQTPTNIIQKSVPEYLKKYIGMEIPPLPEEFLKGGEILKPKSSTYYLADFLLGFVDGKNIEMLWLSKYKGQDKTGKPFWTVVDILITPKLLDNQVIIPDGCMYGKDGVVDHELVALANFDADSFSNRYITNDKIVVVWRANRYAEAFEEISRDGIECSADLAVSKKP